MLYFKELSADLTEEELLELLVKNKTTYNLLEQEITKLKNTELSFSKVLKQEETNSIIQEKEEKPEENSFEDAVDYYLSNLKNLEPSISDAGIISLLPSKNNHNFQKLLLRLKLEYIKNIREIKEILEVEMSGLTAEDLDYFKKELLQEERKLNCINKLLKPNTKEQKEKVEENKLIFVPTLGGNVRAIEDLKNIPREYYAGFYGLFCSIKDSSFKNVKRIPKLNSTVGGFSEVKDTAIRVIFDRIDTTTYAIITAFVKKTQNNKGYRNQLEQRVSDYCNIKPILIASLNDGNFLKSQEESEQELWDLLTENTKKKNGGHQKCKKN